MIFTKNIELLSKVNRALAMKIINTSPSSDLRIIDNNGYLNLEVKGTVFYNDTFFARVKKDVSGIDLSSDKCSILLGFGLGYMAREIEDQMEDGHMLLICEKNMNILRMAFENVNLGQLLSNKKVALFAGNDINVSSVLPQMAVKLIDNTINIISDNASVALYHDFYKNISDKVNSIANSIQINANTLMYSGKKMAYNNIRNLPAIIESSDLSKLENKFFNLPAIIVGGGPSLDKNVHLLKDISNKAIIIATDTVLRKLLKLKIVPHFVCTIDFLKQNYKKFANINIPSETGLIFNQTCYHKVPSLFDKKYAIGINAKLNNWLNRFIKPLPVIDAGQTVTHLCYSFAEFTGCNPLVIIGTDLSFPDKETDHAVGCSSWKIKGNTLIEEKDIYGQKCFTILTFLSMKQIFEDKISRSNKVIINATEGGLNIHGAKNMLLSEVISMFCINDIKLFLDKSSKRDYVFSDFKSVIKKVVSEFAEIEESCKGILENRNCNSRINKLKYNQELVYLFEDISTKLILRMMQQQTIDAGKQKDIEKQTEIAQEYYSTIGKNAKFYQRAFRELI